MTTLQSIQAIMKANFDLSPGILHPEAKLEDLAIDSLAVIEVLFIVEDEFKIKVPPDPTTLQGEIKTIGDLVAYVDKLVAEQHSAHENGGIVS